MSGRTRMELEMLPVFPALVLEGPGISITKSNGTYTFKASHTNLTTNLLTDPTDQANTYFLGHNTVTDEYFVIPFSSFQTSITTTIMGPGSSTVGNLALWNNTTGTALKDGGTVTAFALTLLDDTTQGAAQTTLGVVPGTNVQAFNTKLAALAGLAPIADQFPYFTGAASAAVTGLSAYSRSYLDDVDEKAFKATTNLRPVIQVKVIDDATTLTTGDGKVIFFIDPTLNGFDLLSAHAAVSSSSSSGVPTIQLRNITNGNVDMLSTRITIDAGEYTSYTAATGSVVNPSNDNVATGDQIAVDVDFAGTGVKGLAVILTFG